MHTSFNRGRVICLFRVFFRGGEQASGEGQRKTGAESRFRHREMDRDLEKGSWTWTEQSAGTHHHRNVARQPGGEVRRGWSFGGGGCVGWAGGDYRLNWWTSSFTSRPLWGKRGRVFSLGKTAKKSVKVRATVHTASEFPLLLFLSLLCLILRMQKRPTTAPRTSQKSPLMADNVKSKFR